MMEITAAFPYSGFIALVNALGVLLSIQLSDVDDGLFPPHELAAVVKDRVENGERRKTGFSGRQPRRRIPVCLKKVRSDLQGRLKPLNKTDASSPLQSGWRQKAYPLSALSKKQPTVLVICGPDQNGSIGLVCARHLRIFDYEPTIYHPKRSSHSLHQDFTIQCEKMDIPFLSYLPTEVQLINDAYNLVIDAMLGLEADSSNIKEPYSGILVTLKQIKIPIVSVDVPSGWDAEEPSQDGINPEVLISLMAPKKCALNFSGKHFLAGRFLPYDIQKKYELNLPEYAGTDCLLEL